MVVNRLQNPHRISQKEMWMYRNKASRFSADQISEIDRAGKGR
jgi:hypothetical protein